jgi:hypothetical protein
MKNNLECWQCGKMLHDTSHARFYFEDDSWLCADCFSIEEETAFPNHVDPPDQDYLENQPVMDGKG